MNKARVSTKLLAAKISELAAGGKTRRQVADELGLSYQTVVLYALRYEIEFVRNHTGFVRTGTRRADTAERNQKIAELFRSGSLLEEIGAQFGITRERVRQVLLNDFGLVGRDGGQAARMEMRRLALIFKREAWAQQKHGCTYAEYKSLVKSGAISVFRRIKQNARREGIGGFELNLKQWWDIWQQSGHWHERGRGTGYWMARKDTSKPYTVDNVWIASGHDAAFPHMHSRKQLACEAAE